MGLLAWRVVIFSTPFSAVIAYLDSCGLNLAHSSPGLQLTCHCYFYNPLADQQACHHYLRSASSCLQQSLRLYQQKSAGCSKAWRDPHTFISDWEKKKTTNFFPCIALWDFGETEAQPVQHCQPLPCSCFARFPREAALLAAVRVLPPGIPLALRQRAPRLPLRAMFALIVNCRLKFTCHCLCSLAWTVVLSNISIWSKVQLTSY